MYCIKCGKENTNDAVYCQKCGVMLEAEEETRVAGRDQADYPQQQGNKPAFRPVSEKVFSISPTLMFVKIGYVLAALAPLLLVAVLTVFAFIPGMGERPARTGVVFDPGVLPFPAKAGSLQPNGYNGRDRQRSALAQHAKYSAQNYTGCDGVATPWQRLLGFGDVIIDNASEQGGKVVLKNINSPRHYADLLLGEMRLLDR